MNIISDFRKILFRLRYSGRSYADSKVGIWSWDIINNVFEVNRFWHDRLGYDSHNWKTLDLLIPLIHPDERQIFLNSLNQFLSSVQTGEFDIEFRVMKNGGGWIWVYLNGKLTGFKGTKPVRAEGIILDITRQKQIETELNIKNGEIEALYEESEAQNEELASMMDELQRNHIDLEEANNRLTVSESKFRDIFEKSPIGIIQSTPDGKIISANMAFCKTFGYSSPEELIAEVKDTRIFYKDKPTRDRLVTGSETDNYIYSHDNIGFRKDGSTVFVNLYMVRLSDKFTGKDNFTTFVEDTTELKSSQLERNLFFNNSGDLMLIHTINGRIKQANSVWVDILGWTPDELQSMNLGDLLHPDDIKKTSDFGRLLQKNSRMNITNRYRKKNGEYRIIRWVSILFQDDNLIFSSGRDETERFEAEMELQKMWDRLETALQSGTIGLWDFNVQENTLTVNSNMAEIIGINRLDNVDIRGKDYIHEDDFHASSKAMIDHLKGKKESYITEHRMKLLDGSYKWFFSRGKIVQYDDKGKPLRVAGSITDITEQKEAENRRLALEHQMLQAQKLESLGLLAGGVAHDFNNLLTGILGNADMLLYELPDYVPVQQKLLEIRKAAKRASELTNQMLTYSGKSTFSTDIIDINGLVQEISSLLDVSISKKVKIMYSLAQDLPCLTGDSTQLSQVIMNLILNASEAIENRGEIIITTSLAECTQELIDSLTLSQNMKPANYILLEISDTGSGIEPDMLKQIFDPFFTTKFTGRGLGLAAVSGIIRSHNAGLLVTSKINEGTTFRLYFPSSEFPADNKCVEEKKPVNMNKKHMTVLVADDEAYIRSLTSRMLKTAGFEVLLAENGLEVIDIFREKKNEIACILLDLTMPELDGHEALLELRKIDNSVPIIISSGYSAFDINSKFASDRISGFLQKPYQFEDLLTAIDKAIGGVDTGTD